MQEIACLLLVSFGALFILGVFHFTIYLQQNDKAFRNYALYLLIMSVFNIIRLMDEKFGMGYYLPRHIIQTLDPVLSNLAFLMYVNFLGVVLNIRKEERFYYNSWRFIQVFVFSFLVIFLLLRLTGDAFHIAFFVITIASFIVLSSGIILGLRLLAHRRDKFYLLIIAGTLVSVTGVVSGLIINVFVYKDNYAFAGLYLLEGSMLIEAVFLSAALGYRLKVNYLEKEKLQESILRETRNRELLAVQAAKLLQRELDIREMQDRISKDLHDDIGGSLSSLKIYSSLALQFLKDDPDTAGKMLEQITSNTDDIVLRMDDIVWAMQSPDSNGQTIESRIKGIGYTLLALKDIPCDYQVDEVVERVCHDAELRKNIILIAKEAINNVSKYSQANKVSVRLVHEEGTLKFSVEDNGVGFDTGKRSPGNGLRNIYERAKAIGGKAFIFSTPGEGTRIECAVPVTNISYKTAQH